VASERTRREVILIRVMVSAANTTFQMTAIARLLERVMPGGGTIKEKQRKKHEKEKR